MSISLVAQILQWDPMKTPPVVVAPRPPDPRLPVWCEDQLCSSVGRDTRASHIVHGHPGVHKRDDMIVPLEEP